MSCLFFDPIFYTLTFSLARRAKRIRNALATIMLNGADALTTPEFNWSRFFKTEIEKIGTKIMPLANMNCAVHLPTYNRVVLEEAEAMNASRIEL